jgi:DNA-binding NarL/FixJ family response regulator
MIRVGLVDDHKVVREGVKYYLRSNPNFQVIFDHSSGKSVIEDLKQSKDIDVLIMDIDMPEISGLQLAQIITIRYPRIKIIVLSMLEEPNKIQNLVKIGVRGYLLKDFERKQLLDAIIKVDEGETYYDPRITQILTKALLPKNTVKQRFKLSKRELEVLEHISKGLSSSEIGEKMHISKRTVETHKQNMFKKASVKTSAALVKIASDNGLI